MLYFRVDVGRLGNQMFVYAFARSASKRFKSRYLLSEIGKLHYFKLTFEDYYLNRIKNNIFFRFIYARKAVEWIDMLDGSVDFASHMPDLSGNHRISGYFQSEKYFKSIEKSIRKAFDIKSEFKRIFEVKYKALFKNNFTIVVHIRRKDYQFHSIEKLGVSNYILPDIYYEKMISQLNSPEKLIIFISDDISYVKSKYQHIRNAIFSSENEITDLQMLMHADICVISNSTFSWWGAWLNAKPNKTVYMPKYFLGFKINKEYPVGIAPENWNEIDVYNPSV